MGTQEPIALANNPSQDIIVCPDAPCNGLAQEDEIVKSKSLQIGAFKHDSGYLIAAGGLALLITKKDIDCFIHLLNHAYMDYTLNTPRPASLPLLLRINVLSAFAYNAKLLGIDEEGLCRCDLISPFNTFGPLSLPNPYLPPPVSPTSLLPTSLQETVVHHPWIDLLPFPILRDNMLKLLALGLLDDDELCFDILELSDRDLSTRPAMIVWGDPSDWKSWEINDAFLCKWGLLLRGCSDIIAASNYWRNTRGEKPIVWVWQKQDSQFYVA